MSALQEVNDPHLRSWVDVPPGSDFPIQNLPLGVFEMADKRTCACVAIGNHIVNLAYLHASGYLDDADLPAEVFSRPSLNDFLALGREKIRLVRTRVSQLLRHDNDAVRDNPGVREKALMLQAQGSMRMPVAVGNYSDFYSSQEHAVNVGSMFRDPANALMPNWKHLPVAYHGRASSIVVSGTGIRRPHGQIRKQDKSQPDFGPTGKLDFELELAFVTCAENTMGNPVSVESAEGFVAGLVLFNDWSARDIQQWEYVPLGPFLGKNFASTISPWIVTLDALEPFRVYGPQQDPKVLPYLAIEGARNFDIKLEVLLKLPNAETAVICRSNSKYLYWNINQQLAHHTVNGCNIKAGDVYASGTISGPTPESYGSMLELTWNGSRLLKMPHGSTRSFLEDGDEVVMKAYAERNGVRIGFGECSGTILPAWKLS